jgi:hypothetical protein
MNWKSFKEEMEKQGIQDEYEIDWIDFSHSDYPKMKIVPAPRVKEKILFEGFAIKTRSEKPLHIQVDGE